ncbi:hypothetical protein RQN30_05065 [Arcanobacterium hippocoleae]
MLRKWWRELRLQLLPLKVLAFVLVTSLKFRRLSRRYLKMLILPPVALKNTDFAIGYVSWVRFGRVPSGVFAQRSGLIYAKTLLSTRRNTGFFMPLTQRKCEEPSKPILQPVT